MTWWTYVQRVSGSASAREIASKTGIGATSVNRWQTSEPKPQSVAVFCRSYGRPPLEGFVAAGFLTEDEAGVNEIPMDLDYVPGEVLIAALAKRLTY